METYPWSVLELSEPASTSRDVKRAYARLAKIRRPDIDPQAFTELRAAYEVALRLVEHHEHNEPSEEASTVATSSPPIAAATAATTTLQQPDVQSWPDTQANAPLVPWDEVHSNPSETPALHELDHGLTPPAPAPTSTPTVERQRSPNTPWEVPPVSYAAASAAVYALAEDVNESNRYQPDPQWISRFINAVGAWINHPDNENFHTAIETERAVIALGTHIDFPEAVLDVIWQRYEIETRIAMAKRGSDLARFAERQLHASSRRTLLDRMRNDAGQLFRPMRWNEKVGVYMVPAIRDALKQCLHQMRSQHPELEVLLYPNSVTRLENAALVGKPRISYEVVLLAALTVIFFLFSTAKKTLHTEHAEDYLPWLPLWVVLFVIVALCSRLIRQRITPWQDRHPVLAVGLELGAAATTLCYTAFAANAPLYVFFLPVIAAFAYVILADTRGSFFMECWGAGSRGFGHQMNCIAIIAASTCVPLFFSSHALEAIALSALVWLGMCYVAPIMQWNNKTHAFAFVGGDTVTAQGSRNVIAVLAGLLLLFVLWQWIGYAPNDPFKPTATEKTINDVVVIFLMLLCGFVSTSSRERERKVNWRGWLPLGTAAMVWAWFALHLEKIPSNGMTLFAFMMLARLLSLLRQSMRTQNQMT